MKYLSEYCSIKEPSCSFIKAWNSACAATSRSEKSKRWKFTVTTSLALEARNSFISLRSEGKTVKEHFLFCERGSVARTHPKKDLTVLNVALLCMM